MKNDVQYLKIAKVWSESSSATRLKVGAIIVKDQTIISDGYNGTPRGFDNTCEGEDGQTLPYVMHAESNAITKLAKSNNSSNGATLYTLVSPCFECAKLIIQAGIIRVVYASRYRKSDGLILLKQAGVELEYIDGYYL